MQMILYPPQYSDNSQQIPPKNKKQISFEELELYFSDILKYAPIIKNIQEKDVQPIFQKFIDLVLSLQGKSIKSKEKICDASNIAYTLFNHSGQLLSAIPLALENGKKSPRRKGSFIASNFKVKKDDPIVTEALNKIEKDCKNLEQVGDDITKFIDIYVITDNLLKQVNDVKEHLKVSNNDSKSDEELSLDYDNLKQTFNQYENNISYEKNEYLESKKKISAMEGIIDLNSKRLEVCKANCKDFTDEIEKINKEIQMIKSSKGKINENFEKVKKNVLESLEEKLEAELKSKAIMNSKINEEQQKVMSDLKAAIVIREQKVNYILMIDRSGSMSGQIGQVNTSAQNFLNELKKTNNNNFHFSVVYFNHNANITADTIPISSVSNFQQYVNMNASGGTSYSAGLSQVYNIVSKNIRNKIDIISMVIFTDGGDGDAFQNSYNIASNLKAIYGENILVYVRGLGINNFPQSAQTHLRKIASIINVGSNSNISLNEVDVVDNLQQIVNFFVSISSSYVDFYEIVNKKIESLEKLKHTLYKEEMNLRRQNLATQDFELARLEERKNVDLSKADEKEKLLQSYDQKLQQMKKIVDSIKEECVKYMKVMKESESELSLEKQFDNITILNEFQKKLEETRKKMDLEEIQVKEKKSLRDKELFQAINDKSKSLGFQNPETFKNFKELLEIFQIQIQKFSESSKFFSNKMKNFSDTFQMYSKQLKNEITSNREEEIRKMLTDRKSQNLRMSNPNKQDTGDASDLNLINIIERFISIDPKKFSKEDLMKVCDKENQIIKILSEIDPKKQNGLKEKFVKDLLKEENSKREEFEEDLNKLDEQITIKKEDDTLWQNLVDEIQEFENEKREGINEDEDDKEWEERKKELGIKIKEKKTEKDNHEKTLSLEKKKMIEERKQLNIQFVKYSKELKGKENAFSYALEEILSRTEMWFTHYLDTEDKLKCALPLEYFNDQLLMLEQESTS